MTGPLPMRSHLMVLLLVVVPFASAQRKPAFGQLPDPSNNRIEVRFALGEKPLGCRHFHLVAKENGRVLFSGKFRSGFDIPVQVANLPRNDALELEFVCRKERWHFSKVGERAFLRGWWWVGTDYPPFQSEFQGPKFQDAIWIRYLITDPVNDSGFDVYKMCPAKLKDQKPGPCYED